VKKLLHNLKAFSTVAMLAALIVSLAAPPVQAAVSGKVTVSYDLLRTTSPDIGSASWTNAASWLKTYTDGTGINQVNKVYIDSASLAGSGAVSYDLDSGTLADPSAVGSGVVAAFSRVVAVMVRRTDAPAASTQDENITIGGDFVLTKYLLGWTDDALTIPIHPGGVFTFQAPNATGVAVTASTGDVITITNASSADTVNIQVIILGS
jgi:hypothetical protein